MNCEMLSGGSVNGRTICELPATGANLTLLLVFIALVAVAVGIALVGWVWSHR